MKDWTTLPQQVREAGGVVSSLQSALIEGISGFSNVPGLLKRVIRENMWQSRYVHQVYDIAEFQTFAEFVTSYPPEGLHTDMETLKRLCRDDAEALDLIDQATQGRDGNPTGANQYAKGTVYIVNGSLDEERPTGNSPAAALRRLRKDRPDLHEQVIAGELTPHGAAVKAGFRKPTATIPVDSPCSAIKALLRRFPASALRDALDQSKENR